jgi:hypothetical protein
MAVYGKSALGGDLMKLREKTMITIYGIRN